MSTPANLPPDTLDSCAQEPIRIPGAIQPHGALLVLDETSLMVLQSSANFDEYLGLAGAVGQTVTLSALLGPAFEADIRAWLGGDDALYLRHQMLSDRAFEVSGHRTRQGVILEFECGDGAVIGPDTYYPLLHRFMERSDALIEVAELCSAAAAEFRQLTGFHRTMVYRFDEDWNGTVVAEHGDDTLPSYLDLRFPASDIPAQARELYRLNRLRLIPASSYVPVPLVPALCPFDNAPLDLSQAALRSVSPVHLQYMRNMGTAASMSVSIIIDGKLWGLVSCHHARPRLVSPNARSASDFLGRLLAQQISVRERAFDARERLRLKRVEGELIAHLARSVTLQGGLVERAKQWLAITGASGAAVITDGIALCAGSTPPLEEIQELAKWLYRQHPDSIFVSNHLTAIWPAGASMAEAASGVIAVPISRIQGSYVMWFRPEVVRTVAWGGDPDKASATANTPLQPRASFEIWKQTVRQRAVPWTAAEHFSAAEFRNAIINLVLQHAEERAELTDELHRTNQELESFSYSISHDLRAPFRHIVGYAQLLADEEPELGQLSKHYLDGIQHAASSAGELVDDLLHFSQLGRASLSVSLLDMNKMVAEIRRSLEVDDTSVAWRVGDLPTGWGDPTLVRQALYNLMENAVKYSRNETIPCISIDGFNKQHETVYAVSDNGVGFDMAYAGKLFQAFQRLHRTDEFKGTGIGLALTKRIIDRHRGTLSATGTVGLGATFKFSLPAQPDGVPHDNA